MNIEIFDELPSTHLYLKDKILNQQVVPQTFVLAKFQTQAIGTNGRKWASPKNDAFALSFILPENEIPKVQIFVFFIAFVIQRLLLKECQIQTQLKWPNDIYLQDKKLAGILIEKIGDTLLVGIGLNLNQEQFNPDLLYTAISLFQVDHQKRDQEEFLALFIKYFYEEKLYWKKDPVYFWSDLQNSWLYQFKNVQILLPSGELLTGFFEKVQEDGGIIIAHQSEKKVYYAGTLRLLL